MQENKFSCFRKIALDKALIEVGELQHALDEMLQWAEHVESDLTSQKQRVAICCNESKKLEFEMAKLKVNRCLSCTFIFSNTKKV